MRNIAIALAILSLVGLGFVVWWEWTPLHKSSHVQANERLLAELKPYPRSRVSGEETSGYDNSSCRSSMTAACFDLARTAGYETGISYELPRKVDTTQIAAWYDRQLRGWVPSQGGSDSTWRRGTKVITVEWFEEPAAREYWVSADAHWAHDQPPDG